MVHKFIDRVFCRRMKAIITKGLFQCCLIFNNYLKTRLKKTHTTQSNSFIWKKDVKDNHTSRFVPFADFSYGRDMRTFTALTCYCISTSVPPSLLSLRSKRNLQIADHHVSLLVMNNNENESERYSAEAILPRLKNLSQCLYIFFNDLNIMNSTLDWKRDKSFYKMYVHREKRWDVFLFISSISSGVLIPFQTHLRHSCCGKVS